MRESGGIASVLSSFSKYILNSTDDLLEGLDDNVLVRLDERLFAALDAMVKDLEPSRLGPILGVVTVVV